jgi:hypothetical protein
MLMESGIKPLDFKELDENDAQILSGCNIYVDALLGTGIKGEPRGEYLSAISLINEFSPFTVSVDIPSGVDADTGRVFNIAVNADLTVTFQLKKIGHEMYPGKKYCRETVVCYIGIPDEAVERERIRTFITDDDMVVMASEVGVLPIPESRITKKWRLQPGKMFLIDTEQGRIIDDAELKQQLAASKPYKEWIKRIRIKLDDLPAGAGEKPASAAKLDVRLLDRQQAFGYTQEDVRLLMEPMALQGEEAIGSMGNDAALPVLSNKTKPLYNYFKQLFAQVTNPPIDSIREQMVMSLVSFIGPKPNLLDINNINPPMRLEVSQPVLDFRDMAKIRSIENYSSNKFRSFELDICYPLAWGNEGVEARLASLCAQAVDAVKAGYNILIVTDREALRPVRVGVEIAAALFRLHPDRFDLRDTWRLLGTRRAMEALRAGTPPSELATSWATDEARWRTRRAQYLLYY